MSVNQGELRGKLRSQVQFAGQGRFQECIAIYGRTGDELEIQIHEGDRSLRMIGRIECNRAYWGTIRGRSLCTRANNTRLPALMSHQPEIVLEPTPVNYYKRTNWQVEISDITVKEFKGLSR